MKKYIGLTLGILLLLSVSAFFLFNRNPHEGLILIQETEHGVFYSPSADAGSKQVAEILSSEFDAHFMRLSKMFHFESEQKVPVHVYVDYEAYREMIGRDTEGTYDARDKTIKVYTPVDLEDPNTRKNYTDQVTHELVHAIIQQLNPNVGRTKWLDEGTAYYASNQFEEEFASKINSGFAFLDFPALEQFRKPSYFDEAGGAAYFYSGTLIHYIVETYGIEALNEIIRKPKKIEKILDTSIENLYANWEASLR